MPDYHEAENELSEECKDYTRALNSLKEEIEAIDWYRQRADVTARAELKKILLHNMEEEMEHASMLLEWLRRNMDGWDENLRDYLFTQQDITSIEEGEEEEEGNNHSSRGSDLGIGKL